MLDEDIFVPFVFLPSFLYGFCSLFYFLCLGQHAKEIVTYKILSSMNHSMGHMVPGTVHRVKKKIFNHPILHFIHSL